MPSTARTYDPKRGTSTLTCSTSDPVQNSVCTAWNSARANGAILAQISPDLALNGRFDGVASIDTAMLRAAAGNVAPEISDADDAGASGARRGAYRDAHLSGARWTTGMAAIADYYDDVASPWSLSALGGVVAIQKSGTSTTLTVATSEAGGGAHTITAHLT